MQDWRAAGREVTAGGHRTFVLDVAAAQESDLDPLLVLHGFPSASFDYRHVLPALSAQRRVVLFDFLGFGLSAKPDLRYGIRMLADQAEAVARGAGLDRVALLTHDMGDSVGGELLRRSLEGTLPFEVSERVITNGSIYMDLVQLTDGQQLLLSLPDERFDLGDGPADPYAAGEGYRRALAATFAPESVVAADELDAQWELMAIEQGQALLPRTIRYIEDRRLEERRYTEAIEIHPSPLGIVWGDLDPIAVHAMALRLAEVRADARLITLDGVGHYPMVEAPERFAAAVSDLLTPGATP